MTGWDLAPSRINGVLQHTGTAAEALVKTIQALGGQVRSAAESAGTLTPGGFECGQAMGPVGAALGDFLEHNRQALLFLASRSGHAVEGAGKATVAYLHGDLEQAAHAQRNALKTPEVDRMLRDSATLAAGHAGVDGAPVAATHNGRGGGAW